MIATCFLPCPEFSFVVPVDGNSPPNRKIQKLPYQFVKNGNTTKIVKMRLYQIMELNDMSATDDTLKENLEE